MKKLFCTFSLILISTPTFARDCPNEKDILISKNTYQGGNKLNCANAGKWIETSLGDFNTIATERGTADVWLSALEITVCEAPNGKYKINRMLGDTPENYAICDAFLFNH